MTKHLNNPLLIKPSKALPKAVGIIGAGTIGPDIAYYLKSEITNLHLTLVDIDPVALESAQARIHAYIEKGVNLNKITTTQAKDIKNKLTATTDYAALSTCDWVIEAATEDLALKRKIFSQVEETVSNRALITSNTSSIPAESLFSHLNYPQRTTVTHFFAPAFRNPAVEVIDWAGADPAVIQYLRWLFCITGKVPMLSKDVVCFMLDRVFDNWCNEAGWLLSDASPSEIDFVAGEFVHAGPFFVLNLANGNPIIIETNTRQMEYEGSHYQPADVFEQQEKWQTINPGQHVEVASATATRIRERLLGVLFSQAFEILDRNIGAAEDLDLGCRLAFAFKRGPLELSNDIGLNETSRITMKFANERLGMPTPQKPIDSYLNFNRHILVDRLDGVAIITLRRPEAMNALHDEMTDEILKAMKSLEQEQTVTGFVITGYGTQAFCAGADIGRFTEMLGDTDACVDYARACSRLLVHIDQCKLPVVAALNGIALGGGLELAIRCDEMVATNNAWMQFPEISLGIAPGIGGMVVPFRRWPEATNTLKEMLLRSKKLSASEAAELGIVQQIADSHKNLLTMAIDAVKTSSKNNARNMDDRINFENPLTVTSYATANGDTLSREVIEIIRNAIEQAASINKFDDALEVGYRAFAASAATAAAAEGISAFMGRRAADFNKTG